MRSDFYHTNYALAGLSATQYHYIYDFRASDTEGRGVAFKWVVHGSAEGEELDRVAMVHPIFVVPWGDAENIRSWFLKKGPIGTSADI